MKIPVYRAEKPILLVPDWLLSKLEGANFLVCVAINGTRRGAHWEAVDVYRNRARMLESYYSIPTREGRAWFSLELWRKPKNLSGGRVKQIKLITSDGKKITPC